MKKLLSLITLIFFSLNFYATHLISAEITYTHVSGNDYEVTLSVYRDCSGINLPTVNQPINFQSATCGQNLTQALPYIQTIDVSPVCPGQLTTCNGGTAPGVQQFIYRGIITLIPCSDWVIHWNSGTRSPAITNLVAPSTQNLYVQNTLNNITGTNNNSPQYFNIPYLLLDVNSLVSYNHGASDPDGDSLNFSLATPLTTPGPPGIAIPFAAGYSQSQPILTSGVISFIQQTGAMHFTPSQSQMATVATLIEEFRNGILIASQIREMQVIVSNSTSNQYPLGSTGFNEGMTISSAGPSVDSLSHNSIEMCPNDNVCLQFDFTDPDGNNVNVSSNALAAIPGATFSITNNNTTNPAAVLCWNPTAADRGLNVFSIRVEDNACPIFGIQTFTYDITVLDEPYAGADQVICGAQSAQLNASGGATYTWFDATTNIQIPVGPQFSCNPCSNPIASPLVTTDYYVLSSLINPCENTDTVTITVAPDFTADVIGDTTLCGLSSQQLNVNILTGPAGTYNYLWNNAGSLTNPTAANPIAFPTISTWYTLAITSPQGCTKIVDSVYVEIAQTFSSNQNEAICQGDSLLIYGTYQSVAGTYYDSLQTINGCDSILSTTLSLLNFNSQFTFIDNGLGNFSFSNTSTGNYTISDWNFGDGTTTAITNPNHTFLANGVYTVVLAITDSSIYTTGSCIDYYLDTINVTSVPSSLPCNAGFVVYPDTANASIIIFNSSTGNSLTYFWDFGDGSTSALQNPSHTYLGAGPYQLCLTIDDGNGCIDTFCDSVGVTGVAFKGSGFTINITSTPLTTSVNNAIYSSDFSVYPNPSNGNFIVEKPSNLSKVVQIKLLDASSKLILDKTIPTNLPNALIDITNYSNGLYYLQIIVDDKIQVKQVLKN